MSPLPILLALASLAAVAAEQPPLESPAIRDGSEIAAVPAAVPAPAPAPLRDDRFSPLVVEMLRLGPPNPNQLRTILVRARNSATLPIREMSLNLSYYNARGLRLGTWATAHSGSTNVVPALATNQFTIQGFFVPQFTKEVRIEVRSLLFANGERWPAIPRSLTPGAARLP